MEHGLRLRRMAIKTGTFRTNELSGIMRYHKKSIVLLFLRSAAHKRLSIVYRFAISLVLEKASGVLGLYTGFSPPGNNYLTATMPC